MHLMTIYFLFLFDSIFYYQKTYQFRHIFLILIFKVLLFIYFNHLSFFKSFVRRLIFRLVSLFRRSKYNKSNKLLFSQNYISINMQSIIKKVFSPHISVKKSGLHILPNLLYKMNVILACTAVYGVFAPYTAGGHGILDIQRNSSCDPCPSPTLISPPLSSPPPIPARPESGGKRVAETRIIHLKNESGSPISSFGNSFSTGFWSGGDWRWRWEGRGDEGGGRTWITAGIPLYIQNSVASSRIRSKNSVNSCTCQYHIHLLQYYEHLSYLNSTME